MSGMNESRTGQISAVAAMSDPQRRALFEFVARSENPVTREDAAQAFGVPRSTAAFHLDRLVDEGVLEADFKRLSGKTGPGAGRPSKLYRRAGGEISVSIPPRRYELAGDLLAAAVEEADRTGAPVRDALATVATTTGRELGATAGSLDIALEALDKDREFLKAGDVMNDGMIDAYIALKMQDVTTLRMTTAPVEFQMYYSC